jgi:hypothetical protein
VIAGAMGPAFGDGKEETTTERQTINPDQNSTVRPPEPHKSTAGSTLLADMLSGLCDVTAVRPRLPQEIRRRPLTPLTLRAFPPYDHQSDWDIAFRKKTLCNQGVP